MRDELSADYERAVLADHGFTDEQIQGIEQWRAMRRPDEQEQVGRDYIATIRWLMDCLEMGPDPEDGVWLAAGIGRVLRPPSHIDGVLWCARIDGDGRG